MKDNNTIEKKKIIIKNKQENIKKKKVTQTLNTAITTSAFIINFRLNCRNH